MHLWLKHALPETFAHTGFHIGDTPFFLTAMNIFQSGFRSPYAVCQSLLGAHNFAYFALPHHWLYGGLGVLAGIMHVDAFLFLGAANGLCGAAYLWAVYRFLTAAAPERARLAFLLFTLAGGLGGVFYLASGPVNFALQSIGFSGLYPSGGFEAFFHRYARYELIEGPFVSPLLVMPRLYYTLSMALGFVSLTALVHAARQDAAHPKWRMMICAFLAAWLNARAGMMFALAAACYLYAQRDLTPAARMRLAARYVIPAFIAILLVSFQFRMNPSGAENVYELLRRCAWFGSVVSLLFWHIFTIPLALRPILRRLPFFGSVAAHGAAGFLSAFAVLYAAHQVYYGNLLTGGDTAAAVAVSDWALLGAAAGAVWGAWRTPRLRTAETNLDWAALWFLGFLCIAIAAFGRGRFLPFMPERFLALLGVPLALLSAEGLMCWRVRSRGGVAGALLAAMLLCGICSSAVACLCFQLPAGRVPGEQAFRWAHSEIMPPADARLLDAIPSGVVLAPASEPPLLGDVAACRNPMLKTVFGQPSLEFSGTLMHPLSEAIQRFFDNKAADAERRAFVHEYCVDYVLCPAAHPVDQEILRQFQNSPWLELVMQEEGAAVFRVKPGAAP